MAASSVSLPDGLEIRGDRAPAEADAATATSTSSSKTPSAGRALYATRSFAPGALIHAFSTPLLVLPSAATATTTCNWCLDPRKTAKACTGCRAVGYCGGRCQKAHWTAVHKVECKVLKGLREEAERKREEKKEEEEDDNEIKRSGRLPAHVRAVVQLLLRWDRVQTEVDRLEGNVEAFKTSALWDSLALQAVAACSMAGRQLTDDVRLAETLLCKIHTNAFDRQDEDLGLTGFFVDTTLAMANHSCVPNAVVVFGGRTAYLRAEAPIRKGDEITISYIDYTKPKVARQHGLRLYHFVCHCRRCVDDLDVYEVCRTSPLLKLNSFSFVPDIETSLRDPPLGTAVSSDTIQDIYAQCLSETMPTNTVVIDPTTRLATLRRRWKACRPLIDARRWAVEPLAQLFQQAIMYYSSAGRFAEALAVECFVVRRCDPVQYVAPFSPFRLKGLLLVAKTITNIGRSDAQNAAQFPPSMRVALDHLGDGSLYEAILLMVLRYGPQQSHSESWPLLDTARDMLQDVQSIPGREPLTAALGHWIQDPTEAAAANFFRLNILAPVEALASVAMELLRRDLEGGG